MSYYNRYRNRKRQDNNDGSGAAGGSNNGLPVGLGGASDAIFDLGKNKRVTVRQFRNINLIDIREYYLDSSSGEMRPGKKGISLTEDLYDELLKHRLNIDEALRRFGSKRPRTKTVRVLSDDEDENDQLEKNSATKGDENAPDAEGDRSKSKKKEKLAADKKAKRSAKTEYEDYDEMEPKTKKKRPAPPTLLPHEENRENQKREANATLMLPGAGKSPNPPTPVVTETEKGPILPPVVAQKEENPVVTADATTNDDNENSSDEEFAQSLEAEMNKMDDDISEEE
ncbi:hypothetical protein NCAS_0A12930 [Naumovozyma castellii]|uniref:Transcriptional coactivator p15 (PC4) C-terminal domain-containing protein n=1 Tax=Naumovozyma castellii TaxID=27288 RepID=G0V8Q2_NAUCA|nr:hypothetical protein NCAS_0A12930 [Naumovozyma castellii CBS 4309]CCC67851.1 hypothetical protein NCAS_0A12930 [Naumovozyma castellii CBS 4309]